MDAPTSQIAAEEAALLQGWRAGDPRTLERLYLRYSRIVLRFLVTKVRNDQEAEDLLHDTFLALRNVSPPTRDGPGFRLHTYILGVARNIFLNHLRARHRRSRRELDFNEVRLCELDAGLSSIVRAGEQAHAFLEALREIAIDDQILLELKYFEGLTSDEIAAILDVPITVMPGRITRAKARLHGLLFARLNAGIDPDHEQKLERWAGEAVAALRRQRRGPQP
jgi:RNA polymerase sigma-70 factor, ECF subfamily